MGSRPGFSPHRHPGSRHASVSPDPRWVPRGDCRTPSHPRHRCGRAPSPIPVPCRHGCPAAPAVGEAAMGRGVAGPPPSPSLAPGDGAGPGRAGPGRCPPPEPPRRRWDPVGPVQRLGGGGWGPSPALALGPFPHGVVGTGLGGAACVPPPSLTLGTATTGSAGGVPGGWWRPREPCLSFPLASPPGVPRGPVGCGGGGHCL